MVLFTLSTTSSSSSKLKQHSHQSFSESLMEHTIEDAESIIHRWISPEHVHSSSFCFISSLFSTENREEAKRFIDAVTTLHSGMIRLISVNPTSMKLVKAENLMRISMTHLSKEFYRILKSNRRYLDPESVSIRSSKASDSDSDSDSNTMDDLKMIADCMISSGYSKECFKIYKRIRKSIINEALNQLGFENLTFSQIQKLEWEVMEKKIRKWLRTTTRAVNTLFSGEQILSDHVFSSSSSTIRESAFAEITSQTALALFTFPEKMAKCRKSPEKIFLTLDVYQTIVDLLPKINELFSSDSTSTVRSQVDETLANLRDGVVSMIDEFESSISKESSKSIISSGGIHQLTRYVMNFIVFLADYSDTLTDIISKPSLPSPEEEKDSGDSSPVKSRISRLILFLLCKIDAKSRLYNDVALSYLFLINNVNYVVVKVRSSNLKTVLSEDWVKKHEAKVKKYVAKFEEIVWGEMMTSLSDDVTMTAEEGIKRFSDGFEEAYKRQTGWIVPDSKLRDEIKRSIGMMIIPRYSGFCERNRVGLLENVGFDPEDIGNYLSDLYFGSGGSGSGSSVHSSGSSV